MYQGDVGIAHGPKAHSLGDHLQPTFLSPLHVSIAGGRLSPEGEQQVDRDRNPALRLWGQSHSIS